MSECQWTDGCLLSLHLRRSSCGLPKLAQIRRNNFPLCPSSRRGEPSHLEGTLCPTTSASEWVKSVLRPFIFAMKSKNTRPTIQINILRREKSKERLRDPSSAMSGNEDRGCKFMQKREEFLGIHESNKTKRQEKVKPWVWFTSFWNNFIDITFNVHLSRGNIQTALIIL